MAFRQQFISRAAATLERPSASPTLNTAEAIVALRHVDVFYGSAHAVADVTFDVPKNRITALIGPSGCGKSTVLRSINRMNDLIPGARVAGEIAYHGVDINQKSVDPVEVRRRIGFPAPQSLSQEHL